MLCKILKLNDHIVIAIFYLFVLSGILLLSSFIVKLFFYNEIERGKKRSLCLSLSKLKGASIHSLQLLGVDALDYGLVSVKQRFPTGLDQVLLTESCNISWR